MEIFLSFILISISAIGFGSNFVPIKKYSSGDGLFFQFIFCSSIFLTGIISGIYYKFQYFEPIAMIGGILWTTGNILSVPAIKLIGLGPAICIWGSSNMLLGWSSGKFGIFGYPIKDDISNIYLNYIGVIFSLMSLLFYSLIKINNDENLILEIEDKLLPNTKEYIRKIIGINCAIIAGIFFGINFNPIMYLHFVNKISVKYYIFSHFCGIFFASFIYFLLYCFYKYCTNKLPCLYPKLILPSFLSGLLWSFANICWILVNEQIGQSVSFPIITSTPNIIASFWSVIIFKEIKEKKNYIILLSALFFTIFSSILISLSK